MRSESAEWMARVAARNAIETAKALREGRAVALSEGARTAPAGESAGGTVKEVAR